MDFKQNSQKNEEHKFSKQINISEIDFMFHINRLTKLKDEANILFKAQEEEGLNEYLRINLELDSMINKLQVLDSNNKSILISDYLNLRKLIYSNLANAYGKIGKFKVSIQYDESVIGMDKMFHKSYGRQIRNFIKLENLYRAEEIRNKMYEIFEESVINLYKNEIFVKLDEALNNNNKQFSKFSKGVLKVIRSKESTSNIENKNNWNIIPKEEKLNNIFNVSTENKIAINSNTNHYKFLKWVFGSITFSVAALYILIKYKKKFFNTNPLFNNT